MRANINFISGIHGVGKTTLCNYISEKYCIEYYSASKLISDAKQIPFTSLFIEGIDENQQMLISSINELFDNNNDYLLDGHFCLINKNGEPEKISQGTFEQLRIKNIIVLIEDIYKIWNRLKARNNYEYNLDMLDKLQKIEIDYSKGISILLDVPYTILDLSNLSQEAIEFKLDIIFKH